MNYNTFLLKNNTLLSLTINAASHLPRRPISVVDNITKSFIEGTISSFSDSNMSIINAYAFAGCSSLMSVNFPNCIIIKRCGFEECNSINSIAFPLCEHIN